jgi:diguanylate cyclase (GGDEF)-like protein
MTSHVEVEQPNQNEEAGERRGVSGGVVHVLINLVHAEAGDVGVAQALALAGEQRSFSLLGDVSCWSSLAETVALFNAVALVTGDGAIGLHVGHELLYAPDGTDFVDRLRALGSPEAALKQVTPLLDHFETTSEAVALEVAADHALIQVAPRHSEGRHAHLCEMTRGLLSEIPALYGLDRALITEHECSARGGRHCLYAMSWDHGGDGPGPDVGAESPPDRWDDLYQDETHEDGAAGRGRGNRQRRAPVDVVEQLEAEAVAERKAAEHTVARLNSEVDQMGTLLEGAFSTTLELLDDDVDSLLSQIAARADAVITAPSYLLMIRIAPGAPIQLHHRGLEADEAQLLAAELWREHPDDAGGTRLIVDIASPRRRYGRLAEFLPPGVTRSPSEERVLQLYAKYAANALDIFGVVTNARRSDATARALLSFSETLSRVAHLADSVQLLADTVPSVTGCDQCTVYLWDGEYGQMIPRARTAGMEDPDAYLGPVVPVTGSGRPATRRPMTPGGHTERPVGETHGPPEPGAVTIRIDTPEIDRLLNQHEVIVVEASTEDASLRELLQRSRTTASVVAPLFAAGEFLGVIAANFGSLASAASIHDPDLHERLAGLADQAATALQNLELLEKVSHMAWHDALTGLPNRRLFEDRVEQELVRSRRVGEPVCMFFVDLDHFKAVNDTLGHGAGDDLIQQVSERLVDTVRSQDTVARVGGDEFAILLPGLADQLAIDGLAQRTLDAIGAPFIVFGGQVETTASIGIAIAPEHGDSYDDLLNRADAAMYRAKDRGRNAFQMYMAGPWPSTSDRTAPDDRSLHADLSGALERGEFFILYQPYIDLHSARVVGVEALVRWNHPILGVLEPSSFISLAEKSDIIVALDRWVLDQTCRQARAWLDRGSDPLRLSVNLASRDLSHPDFFDSVERTLEMTGIDPSSLELEITERVVLDKSGPAKENIERLRRLGVKFTIDDFGSGNSSLNRIGTFPVSTLKIDRSFVQVLGPDGEDNALVAAIISMADRLGLACVAVGVETSLQSQVLIQRGCTTAQGYFFSPPLPPEDIEQVMATIAGTDGPTPGDHRPA